MKRTILSLAGIIFLAVAIRIPLLGIPFERDEGEYAYIAWRADFGELPYRDWIDQKPPCVFWVYGLALKLPLDPVRAVHLMGLVFLTASAGLLFILVSRFTKPFWAWTCAVLFVLLSADPLVEGAAANTELFLSLPLLLALLATQSALVENRPKMLWTVLAGVLIGLATGFKQIAVFNWPLLLLFHWLLVPETRRLRETIIFASWSAAGMALVWISIACWFALHHGLRDLIYNVFTHNLEYVQAVPWAERWQYGAARLASLARSQALIWFFSITGLAVLWKTKRTKLFLIVAGWLIAAFVGASASGYFFPHYFQPVLPAICFAAALGAEGLEAVRIWPSVPRWCKRAILVAALVSLPAAVVWPFWFKYSPREAVQAIYPGNPFFAEMPDLGKRLAKLTRPDDRIFVFGAEPELLFYARRPSATRYIFLFPLYGPYSDAKTKQEETAQEVSAHRPAAALYLPNGLFFQPGSEQFFTRWSIAYLRENFSINTYLCMEQTGDTRLISADQASAIRDRRQISGMLLLRTQK